ncbi:MAG: hypothetical protein V9G22_15710 [Ottowia sp.]
MTANFDVAGKEPRVWEGITLGKGKGLKDAVAVVNGAFEGKPLVVKAPLTYAQGAFILPRVEVLAWKPELTVVLENRDPILHSWVVNFKQRGTKKNQAHPAKSPNVSFSI